MNQETNTALQGLHLAIITTNIDWAFTEAMAFLQPRQQLNILHTSTDEGSVLGNYYTINLPVHTVQTYGHLLQMQHAG